MGLGAESEESEEGEDGELHGDCGGGEDIINLDLTGVYVGRFCAFDGEDDMRDGENDIERW